MRSSHYKDKELTLKGTIKYYKNLLDDFNITMTDEISERIEELYPNNIAIENYIRKKILDKLS